MPAAAFVGLECAALLSTRMLYLKHPAQEVKYRKVWCAILIRLAAGRDPGIGTLVQRAGRGGTGVTGVRGPTPGCAVSALGAAFRASRS